jgi:hypothetical protein
MANKNIFLIECSAPHWISVAKELASAYITVSHWTGWQRLKNDVNQHFPQSIFHDSFYAKVGLDDKGLRSTSVSEFDIICEKIWREDSQVVYDMMNRFDHSRDLTFVERSLLFYQHLTYWMNLVKKNKPDLVIFSAPPHVVYDYILLCILRNLKIPTLMFEEIPCLPPFSVYMDDYRTGFVEKTELKNSQCSDEVQSLIDRLSGNYSDGIPKRELAARDEMNIRWKEGFEGLNYHRSCIFKIDLQHKGKYINNEKLVNVSSLYKEKAKSLKESFTGDYANTRFYDQRIEDLHTTKELLEHYASKTYPVDKLENFIYFPLAGQPERTSNPQADILTNQLLIANILTASVSKDTKIALKEHPNQFHPTFAVNMCRSKEFYDELLNLQNVVLINNLHNSFELIDKSLFVVTSGGSAAIEAIIRGKFVLLFGDAWYRNCPGVFRVKNIFEARAAIDKILSGTFKLELQDFINYMENIKATAFKGIADYPPEDFIVSEVENIENLYRIIANKLN